MDRSVALHIVDLDSILGTTNVPQSLSEMIPECSQEYI